MSNDPTYGETYDPEYEREAELASDCAEQQDIVKLEIGKRYWLNNATHAEYRGKSRQGSHLFKDPIGEDQAWFYTLNGQHIPFLNFTTFKPFLP